MPNFLDFLTPEEREKTIARAKRRNEKYKAQKGVKISPSMYALAEFGYYYGWHAVTAVRNNEIDIDEMNALLEGARKVWYTKLVETGGMQTASNKFMTSESSFSDAVKQYADKAK